MWSGPSSAWPRGFGLKTIAEGIEDEETLRLLRAEGVDYGQGNHLGFPGQSPLTAAPVVC